MSIIAQVALLFLVSMVSMGALTYVSQRSVSESSVKSQIEQVAFDVAEEVARSVREFPAYQWLLRYWYVNWESLDIEYDVDFNAGTETEKKAQLLLSRHPELELRYTNTDDVIMFSEEDQKIYAEVAYSWLITRLNQIKRSYGVSFLFGVVTDKTFKTQFFLFSAADEDGVRGTEYEQVYTLGTQVTVSASLEEAMRLASKSTGHLADAGSYIDYYASMGRIGNKPLLIGITYDLTSVTEDIREDTFLGTAYAMAHQLILALIILGLIYYFVLRPLKMVQQNIRLYKDSKDSATVIRNLSQIRTRNEIDQLADDVAGLAEEIDDHMDKIREITAEQERIGTELELAKRIQENSLPNIFPPFPDREDFEIYASMDPAKEVGGDFYDFFLVDPDHLALVIADVSGKGVPASLFMMISMMLIRIAVNSGLSPAAALAYVNEHICENNPEEMFVSVWLGILDLRNGKMIAANAGHEYPFVKPADGPFALLRDKHGFVIGGMAGLKYKEYELDFAPGAKLFVYTDGLPEATSTNVELFGLDRVTEALNRAGGGSPEEILKGMGDTVNDFVGEAEQFDDLTMLCIQYNGRNT